MPPTPLRIAQTTSEVKKQHKQNGPRLPERQMKQLERGHELDVRAARLRDAEKNRKAAKKKREEREDKEKAARKQMGVGLATQLIGYSHTQAQLKNGMEAFLGVKRRKDDEQRRRNLELTRTLEAIAQTVEKEPWDDDDDDQDADIGPDLPTVEATLLEQFVDDDLDDDTLLEAHDLLMSDPLEQPPAHVQHPQPSLAPPPPPPPAPPHPTPTKDDADFARLHGPINKAIENILDQLPEPLIELLSQDVSLRLPEWDPTPGLLHKLNSVGLPPHRLRVKVGSVVSLLRDLNTSSQLSKSQHLRILRAENERLECVVLDGQLEGTKALLTRVPFPAKYRNESQYTFQRLQFPVRVSTDYTYRNLPLDTPSSGFKLPTVPGHMRSSSLSKKASICIPTARPQVNTNPTFKLPALPASNKSLSDISQPKPNQEPVLSPIPSLGDCWDDFLDSGTQIARELSQAPVPSIQPPSITESLPPLSTQDFDFSIDDLDDTPGSAPANFTAPTPTRGLVRTTSLPTVTKPSFSRLPPAQSAGGTTHAAPPSRRSGIVLSRKTKPLPQQPIVPVLRREDISPSQRPDSVSDRPGLFKRKARTTLSSSKNQIKRRCAVAARPAAGPNPPIRHTTVGAFSDFGISTQEVASFFSDDDDMFSGSPPIAV
ncbi:hypothetical protein HBH56_006060 [Parastagonospora nodorum]|uniref:ATP-dependent DNA helicase n=1 Tax=Phaeosphaeria nodorum (strain SN15 / ATCC MYA-4574 / FGSC 10173) TaxID=321614 RepID=A0A7U2ER72_PHANO|nr:hypothetical protein HBH56_006060 [Parastagonospora nodorum]QRC90468.1 hypothetical protein JI435_098800 [Parastagonospora nodorum SN15]KAH3938126.1 hypothetical protein HBH54_006050 [Parastagonospora nodorum]KAH4145565.1 hypothetical protein HBH45_006370 [Parastagonospora nodorum]KAH4164654.1 hypothetical protein HBH44_078020 [Parastagonospora nodorum]